MAQQVNLVSDGLLSDHLLKQTQRLLDSIAKGDWKTYEALTDPALTCIEPETGGAIVIGLAFHQFFFDLENASQRGALDPLTTISSPTVQLMGKDRDVAVLTYTRLIQRTDRSGKAVVIRAAETRVWEKKGGQWKHVHFHRSKL